MQLTHAGALTQFAGDAISQYTTLHTLTGSSEANVIVQHSVDREDWPYICINPTVNGIEMRPIADLYELVYVQDPRHIDYQGIFKRYPGMHEYYTQDLYSRHPTKAYHWKHEGRKDDLITFTNGWKFNPMVHERMIESHPMVQHAIIIGTGREKPAAIIQLLPKYYTATPSEQAANLDDIWPLISQANNYVETYSQLERRYITFAKPSKPFAMLNAISSPTYATIRKAAIDRKTTVELYGKEIEDLYATVAKLGMKGLFRTESD